MAAEYRKFYFDWNDGKYKLNQENYPFTKKMEPKADIRLDHKLDHKSIQEAKKFPLKKIVNDDVLVKDEEKPTRAIDNVDSGRSNKNQSKSKETQSLDEISKGHKVMTSVLNTRLLRLNAAQTLWHKDMNSFIEYLLRLDDDAVLVDLLPILTKRVKDDGLECSTLSMGACLDLLPVLRKLVESKFEDYIVASMDMIREVMKRWWKDLQAAGKKEKEDLENANFRFSRSVSGVYMLIVSMSDRIEALSKRNGKVGEKAKVLHGLMTLI